MEQIKGDAGKCADFCFLFRKLTGVNVGCKSVDFISLYERDDRKAASLSLLGSCDLSGFHYLHELVVKPSQLSSHYRCGDILFRVLGELLRFAFEKPNEPLLELLDVFGVHTGNFLG